MSPMLPKMSDDWEKAVFLQRKSHLVQKLIVILSILIAVNLVFVFRAIYFYHHPTDILPRSLIHARSVEPMQTGYTYIEIPDFAPTIIPGTRHNAEDIRPDMVKRTVDVEIPRETGVAIRAVTSLSEYKRDTPKWFTVALIAVVGLTNQGAAWTGIVSACQDFSTPINQFQCIWGAMATVIAYGAILHRGYQVVGTLRQRLRDNGWAVPRGEHPALDGLSDTLNTTVWHAGIYLAPHDGSNSERDNIPRSVFGFTTPQGFDMHFTDMGDHPESGQPIFRFGMGNGLSKRGSEFYQGQYFVKGGIDFITQDAGDGGTPDPKQDYDHIYNSVSCQLSGRNAVDLNSVGHYFQVYDMIRRDTIVGGALAPFDPKYQRSAINYMWNVPTPVSQRSGCTNIE